MRSRATFALIVARSVVAVAVTLTVVSAAGGCAGKRGTSRPQYQTVGRDPRRDTDAARARNLEAISAIDKGDYAEAESLLKRALTADIMFGPAHNNLGKVYYHQDKLYLAAWEFEYAAKLMPHQAEPRNNIGLVFEAAGRIDEAVNHYRDALALEPENPVLIGNAARARVRRGDNDAELRELLSKLVMRDTRPDWVEWARRRLALVPASATTPPAATQPVPPMQ
jgi:Flp pilus assembly protein TadD